MPQTDLRTTIDVCRQQLADAPFATVQLLLYIDHAVQLLDAAERSLTLEARVAEAITAERERCHSVAVRTLLYQPGTRPAQSEGMGGDQEMPLL